MPTMRSKKAVLAKLYTQFKQYGLTTDISYEDYVAAVEGDAITRRTIKSGWGNRWARVQSQLRNYYPDIDEVINKVEPPKEKKVEKPAGLDALKSMSAKKDSDDE